VELDAISPELEQVERLGGADLVVGILASKNEEALATASLMREALAGLSNLSRAVVVCRNGAHSPVPSVQEVPGDGQAQPIIFCSLPEPGPVETPYQSVINGYRSVFAIGGKLGARGCGVIASQPETITPLWINRLVQPVLELGFDLVAPRYARHKMEGLLNRSVLSPLHRSLYGWQLQNPVGPDFGLSGKLLQRVLSRDSGSRRGSQTDLLASISSAAADSGFQVCESHLGLRNQPPTDWMNLSSLLTAILGAVFQELEHQAAFWQSVRGSRPVPAFGVPDTLPEETSTVDTRRMIESFQLGIQSLQDVWALVLPPTSLLELRKLARMPPDQFRMPDELWARIVYDFALGYRLRVISRDHLLRSITPLYLGWIASYALEMETAGPAEVESRIERLSSSYESSKSYMVSRWRWPDRFNP